MPVAAALTGVAFGCIPVGFNTVQQARTDLVGLDRNDIRMCAGFPTKSHSEGDLDIWSYEKASRPSAGVSIPVLPMTLGASMNVSGGGECRMQLMFRQGRVARIAYAGGGEPALRRQRVLRAARLANASASPRRGRERPRPRRLRSRVDRRSPGDRTDR